MSGRARRADWCILAVLLAFAPGMATSDPLDAYRWHARVLLLSAPDAGDPLLADQLGRLRAAEAGLRERQVVVFTALPDGTLLDAEGTKVGPAPPGWPRRGGFQAVLIGKDGGEKNRWTEPVNPQTIFAEIDRMPMRRSEMGK